LHERLRRHATQVPEKLKKSTVRPAYGVGAGFNVEPIEQRTSPATDLVCHRFG
jgi:hypothetical protein